MYHVSFFSQYNVRLQPMSVLNAYNGIERQKSCKVFSEIFKEKTLMC